MKKSFSCATRVYKNFSKNSTGGTYTIQLGEPIPPKKS